MSLLGLKGKRTSIITLLVELTARLIPQIVKQGQHANQLKFSKRSVKNVFRFVLKSHRLYGFSLVLVSYCWELMLDWV